MNELFSPAELALQVICKKLLQKADFLSLQKPLVARELASTR